MLQPTPPVRPQTSPRHARGFTLVEAGATAAAGALIAILAAAAIEGQPGTRQGARVAKDASQLRGIHQAMVLWANNNNDGYPLPSRVDLENVTVAAEGRAKDTTGNIASLMVWHGLVTVEVWVSPLEVNPHITPHPNFRYDRPPDAVNPARAQWDPSMTAGLTEDRPGHISYAHLQPAGGRLKAWSDTFSATEVVLATRGPEIRTVEKHENGAVTPRFANPESATLRLLPGDPQGWTGHIITNDNHVELARNSLADGRRIPANRRPAYTDKDEKSWPDVIFYDEPDDPKTVNVFLGQFISAGEQPADYSTIWD